MAPFVHDTSLGALAAAVYRGLDSAAATLTEDLPATPILLARQATVTVVQSGSSDNSDSGSQLSGGAIAGIVIGSIAGILLLFWIIRSCGNLGAPPQERENLYHYKEEEPARRRHRHRSRSSRAGRSPRRPEVVYISQSRSPRRSGGHYYG